MNSSSSVIRHARASTSIEGAVDRLPAGDRVAVIASWSAGPEVSRSLDTLITRLEAAGYPTLLVRASDDRAPLRWPEGSVAHPVVLRRPNHGYDFGSWAVGLSSFPALAKRRRVLLLNDSLAGPFGGIEEMLHSFEVTRADVWGATNTMQFMPHLQSYALGFTGGVLADPAIRQFWRNIRHLQDKNQIIGDYEIGFSRLLAVEGFTTAAWFAAERVCSPTDNPAINGWRKLLELGFPFVKRELLRNPTVTSDAREVPAAVRELYGVDVADWL